MSNVLIITSAVKPFIKNNVALNTTLQIEQTIKALLEISNLNIFDSIYLCDGTGYDFTNDLINKHLINRNKIFIHSFNQDNETLRKFHKSYGELLIYKELFTMLPSNGSVYKISGRWMVENLDYIVKNSKNINNLFFSFYPRTVLIRRFVHTAFFKCEIGRLKSIVDFAEQYFIKYPEHIQLERAFFEFLNSQHKEWIKMQYPKYKAVSGTTGMIEKVPFLRKLEQNFLSSFCAQYCFSVIDQDR